MSSPEVSTPILTESTAAPVTPAESTSVTQAVTSASADQPTLPVAVVDQSNINTTEAEAAVPAAVESSTAEGSKAVEVEKPEEKKEKKQGRKPFVDLLNKILKPHPHDKSTPEKNIEAETAPAVEESVPEVVVPAVEDPPVEPEAIVDAPDSNLSADAPAEGAPAEDLPKDVTTPRKERGNLFEKFTAFVMKPKSPKGQKSDAPKEEGEEIKPEPEAVATEAQTAEDVTPASPQIPELPEAPAVEAVANTETPEEVKVEKKEKTPKDLAKLARRFSGRLFGLEKKKVVPKKAEPTREEDEVAAQAETPAEVAVSDAAPQILADSTPEVMQTSSESAPVIAAAA